MKIFSVLIFFVLALVLWTIFTMTPIELSYVYYKLTSILYMCALVLVLSILAGVEESEKNK